MDNKFRKKTANFRADNAKRPYNSGVKDNKENSRRSYDKNGRSSDWNNESKGAGNDRPRSFSRNNKSEGKLYNRSTFIDRNSSENRGFNKQNSEKKFVKSQSDTYRNRNERNDGQRSFRSNRDNFNRQERTDESRTSSFTKREDRHFTGRSQNRDYNRSSSGSRFSNENRGTYASNRDGQRNEGRSFIDRNRRDRFTNEGNTYGERRPRLGKSAYGNNSSEMRNERRNYRTQESDIHENELVNLREKHYSKKKILEHRIKTLTESHNAELRLNRYISISGICSRRDADELIQSGRVKVNGEIVTKVGVKVTKQDNVEVDGETIIPEKKVYLVLNKPKDFVTTMDDPLERKTVMNLIANACKERIYPVGRLDRQTTGVLLFTNDGDLAKKLTHPSYEHKKIYHVFLDKPITSEQLQQILDGVTLEDGVIKADEINYASDNGMEVGIEIHSGKNRIVRRIFEHLGFKIEKLDRVYFAGITKKNLPRGKWRMLSKAEVDILKYY